MCNFPSVEEIRAAFEYDPETGVVLWKTGVFKGRPAGSLVDGYIRLRFKQKQIRVHRIAWLLFYGQWPTKDIDHINGNRADNAIRNLREVTCIQNAQNRTRPHRKNSGLPLGVSWHKNTKKWQARIMVNYRSIFLGYFDSPEEAHAVYLAAKSVHHPHVQLPARG